MQSSAKIHFRTTPFSVVYKWYATSYWLWTIAICWWQSILFCSKHKIKNLKPVNIQYNDIKIKQYAKATYLGCILDETLSEVFMAIHFINKINSRLRFLYRQSRLFNVPSRRLLPMQWSKFSVTKNIMFGIQTQSENWKRLYKVPIIKAYHFA